MKLGLGSPYLGTVVAYRRTPLNPANGAIATKAKSQVHETNDPVIKPNTQNVPLVTTDSSQIDAPSPNSKPAGKTRVEKKKDSVVSDSTIGTSSRPQQVFVYERSGSGTVVPTPIPIKAPRKQKPKSKPNCTTPDTAQPTNENFPGLTIGAVTETEVMAENLLWLHPLSDLQNKDPVLKVEHVQVESVTESVAMASLVSIASAKPVRRRVRNSKYDDTDYEIYQKPSRSARARAQLSSEPKTSISKCQANPGFRWVYSPEELEFLYQVGPFTIGFKFFFKC